MLKNKSYICYCFSLLFFFFILSFHFHALWQFFSSTLTLSSFKSIADRRHKQEIYRENGKCVFIFCVALCFMWQQIYHVETENAWHFKYTRALIHILYRSIHIQQLSLTRMYVFRPFIRIIFGDTLNENLRFFANVTKTKAK